MDYTIERITENNYPLFADMVFWRQNGYERKPVQIPVPDRIKKN